MRTQVATLVLCECLIGTACARPGERAPPEPVTVTVPLPAHSDADADAVRLLAQQQAPGLVEVSGGFVFWIDHSQEIRRVPTTGGDVEVLFTAGPDDRALSGLAIDEQHIYFSTLAGQAKRMPAAGGPVTTLASGDEGAGQIVVTRDYVYWGSERRVRHGSPNGTITRIDKDSAARVTLVEGQSLSGGFAIHGEHLYVSTGQGILDVALPDGAPRLLSAPLRSAGATAAHTLGVCADASGVYWAQSSFDDHGLMNEGDVVFAPASGDSPRILATVEGGITWVSVDGEQVYVLTTEVGSGGARNTLWAVEKRGGGVHEVLEVLEHPVAIDFDAERIYVATHPGGQTGEIFSRPR